MTVYVDDMRASYGRMVMCHMTADSLDELHQMADRIGIQRKWFQFSPEHPHYDVSLSKRKLAVRYGAIQISQREFVELFKELQAKTINKGGER